jgi:hypothetical protein
LAFRNLSDFPAELKKKKIRKVSVTYELIETATAVCLNVAKAFNRHVTGELLQSWVSAKSLNGTWDADKRLLEPAYKLLFSREQERAPASARAWFEVIKSEMITPRNATRGQAAA